MIDNRKTFFNIDGTTSKSFQIGKNKVTIDNIEEGELRFSLLDEQGQMNQWILDVNDNEITFPSGSKVGIDEDTKQILFKLNSDEIRMGLVGEDDPQFGAIEIFKKVQTSSGQFIEEAIKIGVDDTRTHIEDKGVSRHDIPTVWAVWNAIKRVKDLLDTDISNLDARIVVLETVWDPGSWDE